MRNLALVFEVDLSSSAPDSVMIIILHVDVICTAIAASALKSSCAAVSHQEALFMQQLADMTYVIALFGYMAMITMAGHGIA